MAARLASALLAACLTLAAAPASEAPALQRAADRVAAASAGSLHARFGIAIWDLRTGARAGVNAEGRFPLASVFKLTVATTVLRDVDAGKIDINQQERVVSSDIVPYVSSVADDYKRGIRTSSVRDLLTRMLRDSDNTAADTLFRIAGGPDRINATMRAYGIDGVTIRVDEKGLAADEAAHRSFARGGDNAATPDALALLLAKLARGEILSASSRALMLDAMRSSMTMPGRLRAGLPAGTALAHKTGTSARFDGIADATNDAGIAYFERGAHPVIIVALLNGARGDDAQNNAAIAALSRAVTVTLQQ